MPTWEVEVNGEWVKVEADTPEQAADKAELGSFINPLASGLTFGFADEISGALGAIPAAIATGQSVPEAYRGIRDVVRGQQEGFAARNPVTSVALNIAGALPAGGLGAVRALGATPSIGRMATVGGAEAGLAGFGEAEGTAGEQFEQAAFSVPLGVLTAGAGGFLGRAADRMQEARNVPQRLIQGAMDADLLPTRTAIARAQSMGPQATPIDVGGEGMVYLGQQVVGSTPAARAGAERALVSGRRATQTDRLFTAIEDATGIRPDYGLASEAIEDVTRRRSAEARPLWDKAMQTPIPLTDTLDNALDQAVVKQAFRRAQEEAGLTGRVLPNIYQADEAGELVRTGVAPDMQAWSMIKTHLDDAIRTGGRYVDDVTGRPTKLGVSMRRFRDSLVDELKEVNPSYGPALNQWAGETAIINAIDDGRKILSSRLSVDDARRLSRTMSDSEKEGFLTGAVEAIREKMGSVTGEGQMREFSFMESPNFQQKFRPFLPSGEEGDKALNRLVDQFKTERRFKEVGTKVMQGSQTAFRDEAQRMLDPQARSGFLQNVATGNVGEAVAGAVRARVDDLAGGVTPEVKEQIARLITSPGGMEDLVRYLRQSQVRQDRVNAIIDYARTVPGSVGAGVTAAGYNPGAEIMQAISGP